MPTSSAHAPKVSRAAAVKRKQTRARAAKKKSPKRPSFGEWVRQNAGIMKNGPPDLSMREGFGN
jgi:hypothetical protein